MPKIIFIACLSLSMTIFVGACCKDNRNESYRYYDQKPEIPIATEPYTDELNRPEATDTKGAIGTITDPALKEILSSSTQLPGIALAVIKGGKTILRYNQGFGNVTKQEKITMNSAFRIASVSKQFTATAAAIAIDDGLLNLNDPVSEHLTGFPSWADAVTIEQLIHHSSGLPDYGFLCSTTAGDKVEQSDVLAWLQTVDENSFLFPSGTAGAYSNTGYVLLASVVEAATGMPFASYVKAKIFDPLEMKQSWYFSETAAIKNRVIGYSSADGTVDDFNTCNNLYGDGGIYTTISDYEKWATALTHKPDFLANLKPSLFEPGSLNNGQPTLIGDRPYGYGWFLSSGAYDSRYHYGSWVGFRTYAEYVVDEDTWLIAFVNSSSPSFDFEGTTAALFKGYTPYEF